VKNLFEAKFNLTETYLLTYLSVKSRNSARSSAARLMTNVSVQEEIARIQAEINEKDSDTVDRIREALKVIAFTPISEFLSFGPGFVTFKHFVDITPEQLLAVAEVKEIAGEKTSSVTFTLHSKKNALELLMRYHGLIIDKPEITGKDGGPVDGRMTYFPPEPETIEEWLEMCEKIDAHMAKRTGEERGSQ